MRLSRSIAALAVLAASLSVRAQFKAESYDTPSYIQFSAQRFEVNGTETNAVISVMRTGDFRKSATVDYATQDGTAEGNVNFRPCGGTISFASGESFRTISIPIIREQPAPPKTFQVELVQTSSSSLVVTPTADVEIKSQPSLAIQSDGSGVKLTWADVGVPFLLEAKAAGDWQAVSTPATLVDGEWNVTLATDGLVSLFRLRLNSAE